MSQEALRQDHRDQLQEQELRLLKVQEAAAEKAREGKDLSEILRVLEAQMRDKDRAARELRAELAERRAALGAIAAENAAREARHRDEVHAMREDAQRVHEELQVRCAAPRASLAPPRHA